MADHQQVPGIFQGAQPNPGGPGPSRKALIIVDMQRSFTQPSFAFAQWIEDLSPEICFAYLSRVREMVIPNIRLA
jgi:nicotinamidase-related amidase